ncbi:hypothetical protein [Streptomyces xanthophaeus]
MRREVQTFVAEGLLPDWDAGEEEIDRRVTQLEAITKPVTGEEAAALVSCFGPDDCYGVAWTLLHLVEFGPNPVLNARRPRTPTSGTTGCTTPRHVRRARPYDLTRETREVSMCSVKFQGH